MSPAGPTVALVAETAITLSPARTRSSTSITAGRRQPSWSVARSVRATSTPFTETAYTLSAVMARVADVIPSGSWVVPRNQRVAAGTLLVGSPSGNQIQEPPSKDGASVRSAGAEIQSAAHCPVSMSPVSHQEGALQPETCPSVSHTRTDQW